MKADRYIHHVTLTTGHVRRSYREEILAETFAACLPMLETPSGVRAAVPAMPGWEVTITVEGRCMMATIWTRVREQDAPIVTFAVAESDRCGAHAWRALHGRHWPEQSDAKTDPAQPPRAPWCGAVIHPTAALARDIGWIGDFERSLAWAFVDAKNDRP